MSYFFVAFVDPNLICVSNGLYKSQREILACKLTHIATTGNYFFLCVFF